MRHCPSAHFLRFSFILHEKWFTFIYSINLLHKLIIIVLYIRTHIRKYVCMYACCCFCVLLYIMACIWCIDTIINDDDYYYYCCCSWLVIINIIIVALAYWTSVWSSLSECLSVSVCVCLSYLYYKWMFMLQTFNKCTIRLSRLEIFKTGIDNSKLLRSKDTVKYFSSVIKYWYVNWIITMNIVCNYSNIQIVDTPFKRS